MRVAQWNGDENTRRPAGAISPSIHTDNMHAVYIRACMHTLLYAWLPAGSLPGDIHGNQAHPPAKFQSSRSIPLFLSMTYKL